MKKEKAPKTAEEKKLIRKKRGFKALLGITIAYLIVFLFAIGLVTANILTTNDIFATIEGYEQIGSELEPYLDTIDDEYLNSIGYNEFWTFKTDRALRVLQLTDVHIGGGAFSHSKDLKALDAVYKLVKEANPDLVIITGDLVYPVPITGTVNNYSSSKAVAELMEKIGVYWTLCYGNHDTEIYSYYTREELCELYSLDEYAHCLFTSGPESVDGFSNQIINVKNSSDVITHSFYILDSHSYTDSDALGIKWEYDNIHDNQIEWYEKSVKALDSYNESKGGSKITSTMYFHIPLREYETAWQEYTANSNSENVTYIYGEAQEDNEAVCCGAGEDQLFETIIELGNTKGLFCGHDHLNFFSVEYKGVRLTYGMSIDYLAYFGIDKLVEQRGATLITINTDGSFDIEQKPLYLID